MTRLSADALRALALLASCALAGCASDDALVHEPPRQDAPPAAPQLVTLYVPMPAPASADAANPLDYYAWAQAAAPDELHAEQLRLSAPGPDADALIDKVHLGILLGLSAIATPGSEREALALLESLDMQAVDQQPPDAQPVDIKPVESRAVEPDNAKDAGRDYRLFAAFLRAHLEQREQLRSASASVAASREELEALQRSNAQLQQKIDALTRIEEQLIEREQAQGDQ